MKISTEVLAVISGAVVSGSRLNIVGLLEKPLYHKVAKVIEAAGGKWNRSAQAHVFQGDAGEAVESLLLTGEVVSVKKEFGQFETPDGIATMAINMARIQPGMRLMEPSCGSSGQLLIPMLKTRPAFLQAFEIDERSADRVDERVCNYFAAEGRSNDRVVAITCMDFLTVIAIPNCYDVIVMNPPFANRADVLHVLHALKFLTKKGRLVAIMSESVTYRQDKLTAGFRALVGQRGGIIVPLPEGSFKTAGTSVRTVMVAIDA